MERKMNLNEIVELLDMQPLEPEGGFYSETLRSKIMIDADAIRPGYVGKRSLFTAIYYLLTVDDISVPHKLRSDEIWLYHAGDAVRVTLTTTDGDSREHIMGNDLRAGQRPQLLIPAGWTQSAKVIRGDSGFALLSTIVIPGFEREDFEVKK